MYWVVHHRKGVAIAEAENRELAELWCLRNLGDAGPFAITPAVPGDMRSVELIDIGDPDCRQADSGHQEWGIVGKKRPRKAATCH